MFPIGLNFHGITSTLLHQLQVDRFGPTLNSPVCRSALLAQATILKDGGSSEATFDYLAKFYAESRKAIDRSEFADLVYACYSVYQYAIMMSEPTFARAAHCRGLLLSFKSLKDTRLITPKESFLMTLMCFEALEMLSWPDPDGTCEDELSTMYLAYRDGLFLLNHDDTKYPELWMQEAAKSMRISMLMIFQEIYFSNYLTNASAWTPQTTSDDIASGLGLIIQYIISEIPHFIHIHLISVIGRITQLPQVIENEDGQLFDISSEFIAPSVPISLDDFQYSQGYFLSIILKAFLPGSAIEDDEIKTAVNSLCRLVVIGDYLRTHRGVPWDVTDAIGCLLVALIALAATRFGNGKRSQQRG